jgi:hypothetical protein
MGSKQEAIMVYLKQQLGLRIAPFSGQKKPVQAFFWILDPEDEADTLSRNVGKKLPRLAA